MRGRLAGLGAIAALLAACTSEPSAHASWRLGIAPAYFGLPGIARTSAPVVQLRAEPEPTPTATPTPMPDGDGGGHGGSGGSGAAPVRSGGHGGGGSGGGGSSGAATPVPSATPTATPTPAPGRVLVNTLDPGPGALAGVVRDVVRAGAPLAGALVTVVDAADPSKQAIVETGPDGRWALGGVGLRLYKVVAARAGDVADGRAIEALLYPGAPALTTVNFAIAPP